MKQLGRQESKQEETPKNQSSERLFTRSSRNVETKKFPEVLSLIESICCLSFPIVSTSSLAPESVRDSVGTVGVRMNFYSIWI